MYWPLPKETWEGKTRFKIREWSQSGIMGNNQIKGIRINANAYLLNLIQQCFKRCTQDKTKW